MGLDVYLYYHPDPVGYFKRSDELRKKLNAVEFDSDEYRAICAEHNADEYGDLREETRIEKDSNLYPDHLFKLGYFRSSYNGSGINSVLEDRIGESLYTLFPEANLDEYTVLPDWKNALERTTNCIAKLKENLSETGRFVVRESPENIFSAPKEDIRNPSDALASFMSEYSKYNSKEKYWSAYSNHLGSFNFEGEKVVAEIFGYRDVLGKSQPVVYLVVELEENNYLNSYVESLEIVKETIEYVLSQPDPQNYYFHWSG